MAYPFIQPAAYIPNPDGNGLSTLQYTIAFPEPWRQDILTLIRSQARRPERITSVPIRRLNTAIAAVAPDLLSIASHAALYEKRPWLYATSEFPQSAMDALIQAWLLDLQPAVDAYQALKETWRRLATRNLSWELTSVDLLEQHISEGGTATPAPHLYRLLPDLLAARIEGIAGTDGANCYEFGGEKVYFRRAASSVSASGAELISWPPLEYTTKKTANYPARTWKYSAVIRISLRTEPFSAIPRIHIGVSIRRWVTGNNLWIPEGRSVGVYLLAGSGLVAGAPTPERFALAKLRYDGHLRRITWVQGGPAGMLSRLSATTNFPNPEVLAKEPDRWIDGRDGVSAAVVYHQMMKGWHGIHTGLMPSERRRLVEWAGSLLAPDFMPAPELSRTKFPLSQQNPSGVLDEKEPVKKYKRPQKPEEDATEQDLAELEQANARIKEENEQIEAHNRGVEARNRETLARNAERRRSQVAAVVGDRGLTAYLLYQTPTMRDRSIEAVEASLGLAEFRTTAGPDTWSWRAPDLAVRIYAWPLGRLGGAMGAEKPPKRGAQLDEAIGLRRDETRKYIEQLAHDSGTSARLALIELDDREAFGTANADPKFAIRLGCADASMVSQFLVPPKEQPEDAEEDSAFRAAAAWGDGLRQLGMRFVPQHSLGDVIPEKLNQLAFWLVKRQADGPTGKSQFTPIAVLIRPGEPCVMGRSPESGGWVPYPDLLRALTGKIRAEELASEAQQATAAAAFIKTVLREFRIEPTLVVTHAQNTRSRWHWLKNSEMARDRLNFGGGPLQRLTLHGNHLRIARVATSDRAEVPEWWAPDKDGSAGLSKGLWAVAPDDRDNRIFYSSQEKSGNHTLSKYSTKLTPRINDRGKPHTDATKNARNPRLLQLAVVGLQPGDDPATWAMFLHQQRFTDDYREGLALPLIQHLAKLADEYALPHDETGEADPDDDETPQEKNAGDGNAPK